MQQIDLQVYNDLPGIFNPAVNEFITAIQVIDKYENSLSFKLINSGMLEGIEFVNTNEKFYPHVSNSKVIIPIIYIYFLYAYCFYIYLTTEHVMIRELDNTWNGFLKDTQEVRWAYEFYEQYKRNRDGSYLWNDQLINPSTKCIAAKDVNVLFAMSLVFIYLHEISHLEMKHTRSMADETKILAEKDADLNALSIFFHDSQEIDIKKFRAIALGAVLGASINSINEISRLISKDHPDTDVRLANLVDYVELADEKSEHYFMTVVGISLSTFCRERSIPMDQKIFDTVKDCFNYYIAIIGDKKAES